MAQRSTYAHSGETRFPPAHSPLAALDKTGLEKLFHAWAGASGRRYICSVYPVGEPPAFDCSRAVVAAVRRTAEKAETVFVFAPESDSGDLQFWARKAHLAGAGEWHVHLLADTPAAREAAVRDLAPRDANWRSGGLG